MKEYVYWQVDAFSRKPYLGNPCGVVFGADGLDDVKMQTIARHVNLSETVFFCKPENPAADYRVRIFTPKSELPFAGHPTIAAAYSYYSTLKGGERPGLIHQECGAGIIPLEIREETGGPLFMMTTGKPSAIDAGVDKGLAAKMLGVKERHIRDLPIEICSIGLPWMIIPVTNRDDLADGIPDQALIEKICRARGAIGITAYAPGAELEGCSYHIRSLGPGEGIPEDPVCGSGNGAAALYRARHDNNGQSEFSYLAEQGLEIMRAGILHLEIEGAGSDSPTIRLGGQAVRVIEGKLWI